MKYIFVTGAPGSGWSTIPFYASQSPQIDTSDKSDQRKCFEVGTSNLNHQGSYFDPGMEFGNWFDQLDQYTKQQCEAEFDRPFSGTGVRIIRSHMFAHHVDFIRETWPDCPLVLVRRTDDECVSWWFEAGGFNIPYPSYIEHYKNRPTMTAKIAEQNRDILAAWNKYDGQLPFTNVDLCNMLGIQAPAPDPTCVLNSTPDNMAPILVKVIR